MRQSTWFDLEEAKRRDYNSATWTVLRGSFVDSQSGSRFHLGREEENHFVATAALSTMYREGVEECIGWSNLSLRDDHQPSIEHHQYLPADRFRTDDGSVEGTYLVLAQRGNGLTPAEWHLHVDIVLGLSLIREGDKWLAIDEGYTEVARLSRREDGSPRALEIRTSHLKDFLAARGEFLCVSTYTDREAIVENRSGIAWPESPYHRAGPGWRWQGTIVEITESGHPVGSEMLVMQLFREDFDFDQDIPRVSHTDTFTGDNFTRRLDHGGERIRIWGELWRTSVVEPGANSARVRGDHVPSSSYFYVDSAETKINADQLDGDGRWLWFRPDIVNKGLEFRGSSLSWFTENTGQLNMSPGSSVRFGMNELGMVNVYAKDIKYCSAWEQQLWAGFNIVPDGKVSQELLRAQAVGIPANSQAAETFLKDGIELLNKAFKARFGREIVRTSQLNDGLLRKIHRFRAIDETGLQTLAKDLVRFAVESIDVNALQAIVPPPNKQKLGSLKSLENVLGTIVSPESAARLMSPLFGLYDVRLADSHLGGSQLAAAYAKLRIDTGSPWVMQGAHMLTVVVNQLHRLTDIINS